VLRDVAGLEMVARLTGETHGDRRPIIAGGWLEVAVEMTSVIDLGRCCYDGRRQGWVWCRC
jgi:hypothetical protein